MEACESCGLEFPEGELETCPDCYGSFCPSCMEDHESIDHCADCGMPLEVDPPCPICGVPLCDDCYDDHIPLCKRKKELEALMERQQQRITAYF